MRNFDILIRYEDGTLLVGQCAGDTVGTDETKLFRPQDLWDANEMRNKEDLNAKYSNRCMELIHANQRIDELKEALQLILVQRENFTDDAAHEIYKLASEALKPSTAIHAEKDSEGK